MSKMSRTKSLMMTALCIALCVVLPMALHSIPKAGIIFGPMHLPVLLCGLVCGWQFGLLCGLVGPLLSSLLTGMPAAAMLPGMMLELAVYGLVAGILVRVVHTGKIYLDLYISLIAAMLAGRILAGIANALIFTPGGYSLTVWATSYFVTSLPGIVIQLLLIPSIVFALMKAKLVPMRYPG